jgi:hypothetical protein
VLAIGDQTAREDAHFWRNSRPGCDSAV